MKQKKQNRILAALLAAAMMFQMLPVLAFAAGDTSSEPEKPKINGIEYPTLLAAVQAAKSGDTITLGKGVYSLGDTEYVTNNSLTFEGAGTDKTTWQIQAADHGSDGWCDYSFDGSNSITFQDMTVIGSVDLNGNIVDKNIVDSLQGLIRVQNITLKDCVFNGHADYWGYKSTTFDHVTFNAPGTTESGLSWPNYSLWTYTGDTYTFSDCTFNSKGKTINVYRHGDPGYDVTVNFDNCTVNSSSSFLAKKQALCINDSTFDKGSKYILNIINPQVTAERDNTTCTQLFGFGGKAATNNKGRTEVNIDGKRVWENGKMQTHDYTDGEKEQNFKRDEGDWTDKGDHYEREVTKTCRYCGYTTPPITEKGYKLEYDLNGGDPAEGADDETYKEKIVPENEKVELAPAPTMPGYFFHYWDGTEGNFYGDPATIKMTANTKLTAQWGEEPPEVPDTPEGPGCCGEVTAVIIAAGTTVVGYYAGTELLRNCYGLPYWPRNRSELALMLWEDADRPMPESTLLYPDIGQEEEDMNLQHAARWAMENELLPDLNWDSSKPEEEQKFFPNYAVSRAWALHAWNKAQQLKQDA